jgi:SAM-dependent methyltransferase
VSEQDAHRSGAPVDELLDVDWEEHWRQLVRRRQARFGAHEWSQFDRIARNYASAVGRQPDRLLNFLEPYLGPTKTLLDVGAGTGRYAAPLAARLAQVVAVEPAAGMRALIQSIANLTVVPSDWLTATVAPADLVLCSHVLYAIEDPVPFIRKLAASARERVFVYLRNSQPVHPALPLGEVLTGEKSPRMPQLTDLYLLLRQLGIVADVALWPNHWVQRFPDLDAALAACRERLADAWDEGKARTWLADHLDSESDGSLSYTDPRSTVGVIHWSPTSE